MTLENGQGETSKLFILTLPKRLSPVQAWPPPYPCVWRPSEHLPTDLRKSAARIHRVFRCRACRPPISATGKESHHGRWRHIDMEVSNPVVGFGKAHNNRQSGSALQGPF